MLNGIQGVNGSHLLCRDTHAVLELDLIVGGDTAPTDAPDGVLGRELELGVGICVAWWGNGTITVPLSGYVKVQARGGGA